MPYHYSFKRKQKVFKSINNQFRNSEQASPITGNVTTNLSVQSCFGCSTQSECPARNVTVFLSLLVKEALYASAFNVKAW